ncbi:MAG TPA: peptidylprolyl isomerase [Polyangiaceae bacterium]
MIRRLAAVLGFSLLVAAPAQATVIERVVAVIGDRAILLSDLRERALPFLVQIHQTVPQGAQRNAAISQLYKTLIEKLVDEELEQRAAIQAKVVVTAKEIDEALARVASQNNITVEKLLIEAQKSGLDATSYREELRRQLLQTKLINVRLQGRIRVTEDDLKTAYRRLMLEEREKLSFEASWVFIQVKNPAEARAKRKVAEDVARAARTGDFAALARRYSEDPRTRDAGGTLGTARPQELPQALRRVLVALEAGETSGAVNVPGGFAVLKLVSREETSLPEYEEARAELGQRVYLEKMTQARRTWLDTLRRQQHVEVRL